MGQGAVEGGKEMGSPIPDLAGEYGHGQNSGGPHIGKMIATTTTTITRRRHAQQVTQPNRQAAQLTYQHPHRHAIPQTQRRHRVVCVVQKVQGILRLLPPHVVAWDTTTGLLRVRWCHAYVGGGGGGLLLLRQGGVRRRVMVRIRRWRVGGRDLAVGTVGVVAVVLGEAGVADDAGAAGEAAVVLVFVVRERGLLVVGVGQRGLLAPLVVGVEQRGLLGLLGGGGATGTWDGGEKRGAGAAGFLFHAAWWLGWGRSVWVEGTGGC